MSQSTQAYNKIDLDACATTYLYVAREISNNQGSRLLIVFQLNEQYKANACWAIFITANNIFGQSNDK